MIRASWSSTRLVTPNAPYTRGERLTIAIAWAGAWIALWVIFKPAVLPSPLDVLAALPALLTEQGLAANLLTSFTVNVEALAISAALALPLAYVSRVPVMQPLVTALAKLRFLSPAVFFLLLVFLTSSGSQVKLGMLVLGETFFLLTTMLAAVQAIPSERFDDARTLRMSEWQGLWYVVVLGTADAALDALRDNAAMGWSMLMMVEGIVRSEGGIGVLLVSQEKFMNYAEVYAIVGAVLAVGMLQDAGLTWARTTLCPYVRFR